MNETETTLLTAEDYLRFPVVEPDHVHLERVVADARERQHIGQARSGPLRAPDRAGAPLAARRGAPRGRLEETAPVPGTLDVGDQRLAGQRAEVVEGELDLPFGAGPPDRQHIGGRIDDRRGRVVAHEEELVGRDEAV